MSGTVGITCEGRPTIIVIDRPDAADGARVETGVDQGPRLRGVEQALAAQDDWPAVHTMRRSDDAREGARAFAQRRAPRWTAR